MSESRRSMEQAERGQTLPDFAVGIAIFLLTITFIAVFVPQLTLPFEDQEQPVVAERITNDVAKNLLSDPQAPSKLNESRTIAFFEEELSADQLGIDRRYSVNITLRTLPSDDPNSEVLCADETDESITNCGDGTKLAAGAPVPEDDRSVSTAKTGVFTGDTSAVLEVRVW